MENSMPENSHKKLPKIEAFKAIQKSFAMVGITPKLATEMIPLNGRISMGFLILGTGTYFLSVYIFNYAETFSEFMQSIYIASAGLLVAVELVILILQMNEMFEYINYCNRMLNTGK